VKAELLLVFMLMTAFAHGTENFTQAQNIIDAKTSCNQLTEEQFEILGDYFMEQMHPGEAHETMDAAMGGEGSQSLHDMHVAMGIRFYCNNNVSYGMMGGLGMMGGFHSGYGYIRYMTGANQLLTTALLVGLIILVYLGILKLLRGGKK